MHERERTRHVHRVLEPTRDAERLAGVVYERLQVAPAGVLHQDIHAGRVLITADSGQYAYDVRVSQARRARLGQEAGERRAARAALTPVEALDGDAPAARAREVDGAEAAAPQHGRRARAEAATVAAAYGRGGADGSRRLDGDGALEAVDEGVDGRARLAGDGEAQRWTQPARQDLHRIVTAVERALIIEVLVYRDNALSHTGLGRANGRVLTGHASMGSRHKHRQQ